MTEFLITLEKFDKAYYSREQLLEYSNDKFLTYFKIVELSKQTNNLRETIQ